MKNDIKNLSCEAIDAKPIPADWSVGYGETWEYWEACRCACGAAVLGREGDTHRDVDSESDCEGSLGGEGPMMNYFYPAPIDNVEDAARTLVDTCLCVVSVNGETGLALTGGGMDLSWEICAAFVALGFLPPLHFCDLPAMAGKDPDTDENHRTIGACLRSCEVAAGWANDRAKRLRRTTEDLRSKCAKRA